jgi:hypothetical protein
VRLRPYLEMTVDEYWSRVIDVYGAVGVGSDGELERTAAHINAASATNIEMIFKLGCSRIWPSSFCQNLEVFQLPP